MGLSPAVKLSIMLFYVVLCYVIITKQIEKNYASEPSWRESCLHLSVIMSYLVMKK